MNLRKMIRGWLTGRAYLRQLNDLSRYDLKSLKADLETAVEELGYAEEMAADGMVCKADEWAAGAVWTIRAALGERVLPPMYAHYQPRVKTRWYLFGLRLPASPKYSGSGTIERVMRHVGLVVPMPPPSAAVAESEEGK